MFVAADAHDATVACAVCHYKRQEDATMTAGKFDEELARMSRLTAAIDTDDLLLCKSGARRGAGCAQYGSCAPPAPCRR